MFYCSASSVPFKCHSGKCYTSYWVSLLPMPPPSTHTHLAHMGLSLFYTIEEKAKTVFLISSNGVQKVFPRWTLPGKLLSSHGHMVMSRSWRTTACISSCTIGTEGSSGQNQEAGEMLCFPESFLLCWVLLCLPEKASVCGYLQSTGKEEQFGHLHWNSGWLWSRGREGARETLKEWWG